MDLKGLKIFAMMQERMGWLAKRQEVVAENIANADTPAYRPKDLKELDFSRHLRPQTPEPTLTLTSARHIAPTRQPETFRPETDRNTYEISPTGNAVVLEEQMMKVAQTQADYRLAANLYQKHVAMLREALGLSGR